MLPRRSAVAALALCALAVGAHVPVSSNDAHEVRALWVDSFNPGLRSPAEIDGLIARAKQGNLNTIMAQVRRNAQGLYALSPEGWVENYTPPAGFDPLQSLVDKAHAEGIEVHAWANIGAIFSGNPSVATASFPCKVPCNPSHIFNLHGWGTSGEANWLTRAHPSYLAGTTFNGYRQSPSGLWFMDLGHPAAAEHTLAVLLDVVRNYGVDGIHLDYVRYPEMPIVSPRPPGVGLPFSIGYNETSVRRFNAAYGRPVGSLPDPWDSSFSSWRRDQVRAFVRRLYLEMNFLRPEAKLSAALITFFRGPNSVEPRSFQQTEAYYRVFQDWGGFMQEGILDMSMPMIYKSQHLASHVVQFNEWIEFTKNAQYNRHGVHGLGAFLNSLENTVVQIGHGRSPSALGSTSRGFNFFSYNATNQAVAGPGGTPLRPRDELFLALTLDGAYAEIAPFPDPVAVPPMSWKTDPRQGHLLAQVLDAGGRPADGALVRIQKLGAGPRDEAITQYADGNGYVGGVDLAPGAYQLVVEIPGGADRVTVPQPVLPGRVTRVVFNLGQPARGPMARAERALGAHERTDHLPEEASDLAEWLVREPVPEDLRKPETDPLR
jgi:uncharacterized lipoprotein YddW (UPF0748 family)